MIQFENIVKRFQRHEVLKGVNLTIEPGQRVALVGSSGAGKTTLIRCLLGEYGYAGSIRVDGMEPRKRRREVLAKIGFVPQQPPAMNISVAWLIRCSARLCACDPRRIAKLAKRLGFDAGIYPHRSFTKLSAINKQKLLIAIALGRESELLVMDEPMARLDTVARHVFCQLLAAKQPTMLLSCQRLDEAANLANRVIELDRGRVVLDDQWADSGYATSRLSCHLRLSRWQETFIEELEAWGFVSSESGFEWSGYLRGQDVRRFLGVLSRHAVLLAELDINQATTQEVTGYAG